MTTIEAKITQYPAYHLVRFSDGQRSKTALSLGWAIRGMSYSYPPDVNVVITEMVGYNEDEIEWAKAHLAELLEQTQHNA